MNQQLATLRPNEYSSNNAILKSQKVLVSTANFHLKTEQQEKDPEEHRSPEQGRVEFRETTWRKPRMPYNKFPDAFQMRQKRQSTNKQILEDFDKIVKHSEYKEVQKYLNPISIEKRHEEKSRPHDSNDNPNPLAAYQKYLQIKNKFSEQLQERDVSLSKYKTLSSKAGAAAMRIQDCITLEVVKRGHNTGTLKKMLHVPTLQLLCVREEPLNTKESRHSIKEWVNFWQNKLNREASVRFLKIYGMAFNYPEGAVSILTEYQPEGSLLDLLAATVTLPESVMKEIFSQLIDCLQEFYELSELQFGGLSPSQVLLSKNGVQLGMGLYYHFSNTTSNSIYHYKTVARPNLFELNLTQKNFMKPPERPPTLNLELERSLDVFKLGLVLLECAIGGFQNFQHSGVLLETVRSAFSEEGQRVLERDAVCCLIHSQPYLLEWAAREDRWRADQKEQTVPLIKFLRDRYSLQCLHFLCSCLKLTHGKRATLSELANHAFLRQQGKDCGTVPLSLRQLQSLRAQTGPPAQVKQQRLDKFIGHVLQVISNCPPGEVAALLKHHRERILRIGPQIGLNSDSLGEQLLSAISAVVRSQRP